METRFKATAAPAPGDDPFEFVMSDASVDRMGDIIEQDGWELANFTRNPIALFGHSSAFPIGTWSDVGVRDGQLRGRLKLMPAVSDRLRELHAAVDAGVLRAVSVGFHEIKSEPLDPKDPWGGFRFIKQELVECSLVSVPANPNALQVARSIGISRETQRLIFGELAFDGQSVRTRGLNGEIATTSPRKPKAMNLSERIQAAQAQVNTLRDTLAQHLTAAGDDLDDAAMQRSDELNAAIDDQLRRLETLERAEKALGSASAETATIVPPSRITVIPPGGGLPARPFATAKPKEEPGHLIWRAITVETLAHIQKKPKLQVLQERYGDDVATRHVFDWWTRAATAPAAMTTTNWAAELVRVQYGEWFDALMPKSIYGPLSAMSMRATLGQNGSISMPTRQATPTVAGSFVGEGAPIPVRQAAFIAIVVGLKKMAVITTYTRELAEHSTPQIEQILRQLIQEDTSVSVDTILIDNVAATTVRPAGLRNGVAGLTPTAGGGFAALVGDIKALVGVLGAANALQNPVWIMNDLQRISIALTANAQGVFPFAAQIENDNLFGYPVISSTTQPAGTVILMNASDLVTVEGDDPRFEVSDQATLHMEDTTPLAIGTPGSPPTVAAPARSLFQTDSLGLRMILPMNWALRRTGTVAWVAGVTW